MSFVCFFIYTVLLLTNNMLSFFTVFADIINKNIIFSKYLSKYNKTFQIDITNLLYCFTNFLYLHIYHKYFKFFIGVFLYYQNHFYLLLQYQLSIPKSYNAILSLFLPIFKQYFICFLYLKIKTYQYLLTD